MRNSKRNGPSRTLRELRLLLREDAVGFFQRFFGADVVPDARDAPRVNRCARIKPLDEATGLVRIVSFGDVLLDHRDGCARIKVKSDAGDGALRLLRFFFEEGDLALRVHG